jgi:predicted ArsR family transcriptional regulator
MKEYTTPTKDTVRALVELFKSGESLTVSQLNEKVEVAFTPGHLLALERRGYVEVTRVKGTSGEVNSYQINDDGFDFLDDHSLDMHDNVEYIAEVYNTAFEAFKWKTVPFN